MSAIEIANLTRRFGSNVAVNRLSLNVERGEVFAVVGPDGAGKTTLIRLICGALATDEGTIRVDGIDAVREPQRVQAAIGYMPQRFSLYPDLSVMENLRFYGDIFGVIAGAFTKRSTTLLEDFALTPFTSRLAEELSGGMKQKLALACALIHDPATILLDEPTAGVDPASRREFWNILFSINQSGTTVFVSTPYMDEAERANRVAFMSHGEILTCGSPQEIKTSLQGEVVEIVCPDRASARHALHEDTLVQSVEIFGDTLHALVASSAQAIPEMKQRLSNAGVVTSELRVIDPSLEDVFVEKLAS